MLAQLTISNFAIVRELEIDFHNGMTAITGETGAGKSIAIDALGLCLGGRAEADMVRAGASRADLCARFSLKDTPAAQRWLEENQLEEGSECLLRRVISSDGRSRGFINGTAVPLSQLRELGQVLIQIHGQHAHQLLLKPEHQRTLLDGYAGEYALTQQMAQHYRQWHQSCRDLAAHQQQSQERTARAELLQYQLKELNEFAPQPGEYEQIDAEYKRLANSGQLLSTGQQALQLITDGEDANIQSQLYAARQLLTELAGMDEKLSSVLDMLEEAAIQLTEAGDELRHYCDRLDMDPNRLYELEQRLSRQINLARKHRIAPEALPAFHQSLLDEQALLDGQADSLEALTEAVAVHHQQAMETARRLHEARRTYADELSQLITESMHLLSMPHGRLSIDVVFEENHLTADGADRIEFRGDHEPWAAVTAVSESRVRRRAFPYRSGDSGDHRP
ncbi:DNA repair protein [Atlantibacter hermannii]|nr:DNA repair protein [Atlantibacter hermannii]